MTNHENTNAPNKSGEIVTMVFDNEEGQTSFSHDGMQSSRSLVTVKVDRASAQLVAQWYGSFHAGDTYTITIDGELIEHDLNGEIMFC